MGDMKRKVVYNACHGGFGLSEKGREMLDSLKGDEGLCEYELERHDLDLVKVVETLGDLASASYARLKVGEVEGLYHIGEYDGFESICTPDSYVWH
jgi:hypothetical protein